MSEVLRNAWVEVDLDAISNNAAVLARVAAPAELCVSVKADGYGHGMVPVAKAALKGGATRLGVALVEEGIKLRQAGVLAPILVLSEPQPSAMAQVVEHGLSTAIYSQRGLEAAEKAVSEHGSQPLPIHIKVDTGMHRVGASPEEAIELLRSARNSPHLFVEGFFTHFAVADEPNNPLMALQAKSFAQLVNQLQKEGISPPLIHCSNSAATLLYPNLKYNMVRCGIALYGLKHSAEFPLYEGLQPAMKLRAGVSYVKRVAGGSGLGYVQDYILDQAANVATVPLGYGDGLPRSLGPSGGQVLIGGRRHRIAQVSMDQFVVDCRDSKIEVGEEVVILGTQRDEAIWAEEIAQRLGTNNYEVVTRIGPRVPRRY